MTEETKYMFSTLPEFSGNNLKLLSVYCNDNEREKICLEVLPDFIGNFVNLRVLNLSTNRLSILPSIIGNLKNFTYSGFEQELSYHSTRLYWKFKKVGRAKPLL